MPMLTMFQGRREHWHLIRHPNNCFVAQKCRRCQPFAKNWHTGATGLSRSKSPPAWRRGGDHHVVARRSHRNAPMVSGFAQHVFMGSREYAVACWLFCWHCSRVWAGRGFCAVVLLLTRRATDSGGGRSTCTPDCDFSHGLRNMNLVSTPTVPTTTCT